MSLIKCKECGREISDKARSCPNCGCPIEKGLVCSECGSSLNPNDMICPKCGNPIKGNIGCNNKPIARYLIPCLIVVLLLVGGYLAYTYWGETDNPTTANAVSSDTLSNYADLSEQVDEAERAEEERKIEAARQSYLEREKKKEQQQEREWLYGTWQCNVDGGAYLKISITASNLTEVVYIPSQGETKSVSSYYIDGDRLCTDKTKYRIDRAYKRLLGDDGTPFSRVSASSNSSISNNRTTNGNGYNNKNNRNNSVDSRIASLERSVQDNINELNAMVTSGRMHPVTLMYLKQNLPRDLTELMEYYANQGNSSKYNEYAYKKRVVMKVFRDLRM